MNNVSWSTRRRGSSQKAGNMILANLILDCVIFSKRDKMGTHPGYGSLTLESPQNQSPRGKRAPVPHVCDATRELIPGSRNPGHFSNPEIPGLSSPNTGIFGIKLCRSHQQYNDRSTENAAFGSGHGIYREERDFFVLWKWKQRIVYAACIQLFTDSTSSKYWTWTSIFISWLQAKIAHERSRTGQCYFCVGLTFLRTSNPLDLSRNIISMVYVADVPIGQRPI